MKDLYSTVELYLPYNRALTSYEAVKADVDGPQDHPHHHRPSAVIAL